MVLFAAWELRAANVAQSQSLEALASLRSLEDAKARTNYSRIRGVVLDEGNNAIEGANVTATTLDKQEAEPTESVKGGSFELDVGGMKLSDNTTITLNVEKNGFSPGITKFRYAQNLAAHEVKLTKKGS
jgi:hypothetical protein